MIASYCPRCDKVYFGNTKEAANKLVEEHIKRNIGDEEGLHDQDLYEAWKEGAI